MVGAEGGNVSKAKLKEELIEKFPSVGERVEWKHRRVRRKESLQKNIRKQEVIFHLDLPPKGLRKKS